MTTKDFNQFIKTLYILISLTFIGCLIGCDTKSIPTQHASKNTNERPVSGSNLYIFVRNAKLLNRDYKIVGCAKEDVIAKILGWIPYPKAADGKTLRDADDGTVISALYQIAFSEDQLCIDGSIALKDRQYLVNPAALAPYRADKPAYEPTVESVELAGNGCSDSKSYSFAGTLNGSNLSIMFNRFTLKRGSSLEQQANCKILIKLKVPKEGLIKRFKSFSAYRSLFGEGTKGRLDSRVFLSGIEIAHQKKENIGPIDVSETLSNDQEPPKFGFCQGEVEFLIVQNIELNSINNESDDSFEFVVDSADYWLEIAACP